MAGCRYIHMILQESPLWMNKFLRRCQLLQLLRRCMALRLTGTPHVLINKDSNTAIEMVPFSLLFVWCAIQLGEVVEDCLCQNLWEGKQGKVIVRSFLVVPLLIQFCRMQSYIRVMGKTAIMSIKILSTGIVTCWYLMCICGVAIWNLSLWEK